MYQYVSLIAGKTNKLIHCNSDFHVLTIIRKHYCLMIVKTWKMWNSELQKISLLVFAAINYTYCSAFLHRALFSSNVLLGEIIYIYLSLSVYLSTYLSIYLSMCVCVRVCVCVYYKTNEDIYFTSVLALYNEHIYIYIYIYIYINIYIERYTIYLYIHIWKQICFTISALRIGSLTMIYIIYISYIYINM